MVEVAGAMVVVGVEKEERHELVGLHEASEVKRRPAKKKWNLL